MAKRKDLELRELHENEFISIAAIFCNEVKDLRKTGQSTKWSPLEFEIKLSSHGADQKKDEEEEIKAEICLYVKCSETYPETTPFLDIKKFKGISPENIKALKSELHQKCKTLLGREMMMEVMFYAQDFLSAHKIPQYESFFDEMVSNNEKRQREEAQMRLKQDEALKSLELQKLEAIQQEKQRKIEALRDAHKRTRFVDEMVDNVAGAKDDVVRHRSRSTSASKGICSNGNKSNSDCKEMLNSKLKFTGKKEFNVTCGHCISHNQRGCVTYYGIDTVSGVPVVVIKWTLNFCANHKLKGQEWEALQKEQEFYLKQISNIEQEFKTLRQLSNKYLVHYLGLSYVTRKDKIVVTVLQENISGCPIELVYRDIHITVPQLQHYARQILEALKYLHDNSVVHKNLRTSSLFIDSDGVIRVSDYSLDKRFYDLYRTLTKESEIDIYPPTIGKGGKKGDIYRLGILLISLTDESPNFSPVKIPEHLNPTFKDFLSKCLLHDEQDRWSAEQLLSHPFLATTPIYKEIEMNNDDKDDEDSINQMMINDEGMQGSRLRNEFDILKVLGKGGFGHVWKVKNKLDSRAYALKRIPLNPVNKQLNRKIKREVKLLSRLNHENIVRYYNSWIEGSRDTEYCMGDTDGSFSITDNKKKAESLGKASSSVQWEIHDKEESSSEGYECEDDDDDDDDFIVFMSENSKLNENDSKIDAFDIDGSSTVEKVTDSEREPSQSQIKQFMYIQMEFCEKSTLRTAIDNGLHKDVSLVWRLFREIVEGLHYIHQQGVIHRDLKPVNIFLDSKDHVKIGDFGLATDVISKSVATTDMAYSDAIQLSKSEVVSKSEVEDGTQTGQVGTTFYVAPELASSVKVSYSQKVDIYSLGIIFFEMCYPPAVTGMERNIIITNLRHRDISFPSDASEILTEEMIQIISWLLQHDVSKRPSSNELITSKYIPPLLMEETELNSLLHTTVSNPQSRMYKHMISALFDQEASTEFDFTYDIDAFKGQSSKCKPTQIFSNVANTLNKIMKLHGAVYFSVPTLMPKNSIVSVNNGVHIMEHGGGIVMLPYNLRIPFARHIARREIDFLKRYSLEKVFRQQKVFGCHPREQYEFAFDIVTPTPSSFLPDAEVISAVSEIISEFSSLDSRSYYIRMNHASLLKAIFLYSEVDEKVENKIIELAGKQKNKIITKSILTDNASNLQLSQRSLTRLGQFVEFEEGGVEKIISCLHPVMQKKSTASALAKSSIRELENIVSLAQSLGVKSPIFICPGLAHNVTLFSGMVFQCVCKLKSTKRKDVIDILAMGGRYDKLIGSFKLRTLSEGSKSVQQSGVGVSIAIESIVAAELEANEIQSSGVADFVIYSEDAGMTSEKGALLKELWDYGVRAMVLYDKNLTFDDALDFCKNLEIPHILILKKDEPGIIKIRIIEKDRMWEKKIIQHELKEQLQKLYPKVTNEPTSAKVDHIRSSSFSINVPPSPSNLSINVRFLPPDKTHAIRKREQNITTHVVNVLQTTFSRHIELIPIDLKMTVIGTIISHCDISASVDGIQRSFDGIIDEYNKHKKYLSQLCEEICDIRNKKGNCSIVLYSLPDNNFRVLL